VRRARGLNIFELIWITGLVALLVKGSSWLAWHTGWPISLAAGAIGAFFLLPLVLLQCVRTKRRKM
jgi:hypothetical protein